MNLQTLAIYSLVSVALLGCNEPLPTEKLDYVGHWASADSRVNITITREGRVDYQNQQLGQKTFLSASIKDFEGLNFNVGFGPFRTQFSVTQAPTQNAQGSWFMVMDGHTLAKIQ